MYQFQPWSEYKSCLLLQQYFKLRQCLGLRPVVECRVPVAEWEHNFLQIVLLIPISCICIKGFHVLDSHMQVVWLHILETSNASLWPQSNSYVEVNHVERIHHSIVPQHSPIKKECPPAKEYLPWKTQRSCDFTSQFACESSRTSTSIIARCTESSMDYLLPKNIWPNVTTVLQRHPPLPLVLHPFC